MLQLLLLLPPLALGGVELVVPVMAAVAMLLVNMLVKESSLLACCRVVGDGECPSMAGRDGSGSSEWFCSLQREHTSGACTAVARGL